MFGVGSWASDARAPGTTTGRPVEAALALFWAQGFESVAVGAIAEQAGVTTGSLYHHFANKAGLYQLVRADVERRVVDRLEGAAATRPVRTLSDLTVVLLIGFDYLVSSGFARLLAELPPGSTVASSEPDAIERLVGRTLGDNPALAGLVAAVWRRALWQSSDGPVAAVEARAALSMLLTGTWSSPAL